MNSKESIMCPQHREWDDFMRRLVGPEGCNFHSISPNNIGPLEWNCSQSPDYPLSRSILGDKGLDEFQIEASLVYFSQHGGACDCEVVLNVEDQAEAKNDSC